MRIEELLRELIRIPTVNSENSDRTFEVILSSLKGDYEYQVLEFDGVKNLILWKGEPILVLNAHYDVVPADEDNWTYPPFSGVKEGDLIYGRGASDDKGAVAAFIKAFEQLDDVLLMIVGDEERGGKRGTEPLVRWLKGRFNVKHALVGEPVSRFRFGDNVRRGRRGVLALQLKVRGRGGHSARVRELLNPIDAVPLLTSLYSYFPEHPKMSDTTVAITSVHADAGAVNMVPTELNLTLDIRYNLSVSPEEIKSIILRELDDAGYEVELLELVSTSPFVNEDEEYEELVLNVLSDYSDEVTVDTYGGSSDARFFAYAGYSVLEIGPAPRDIHAPDESVSLRDLELMAEATLRIWEKLRRRLLSQRTR